MDVLPFRMKEGGGFWYLGTVVPVILTERLSPFFGGKAMQAVGFLLAAIIMKGLKRLT